MVPYLRQDRSEQPVVQHHHGEALTLRALLLITLAVEDHVFGYSSLSAYAPVTISEMI